MIEINLVPDVKQELIKAQRVRSTVVAIAIIIGLASIGVLVALALWVSAVQTVRSGILDQDIKKGSDDLSKVEDLSKILTIQNQLTKISSLNASKNIESRLFDVLLKIIPPAPNDIQISSLKVDSEGGTIKIEGQAPNSYAGLEVFKKTILATKLSYTNDDKADKDGKVMVQSVGLSKDLSTGETSYGEDSSGKKVLRFSISFKYAPELFSPASKNVNLAVIATDGGNVSDSYVGIPKNIFVDKAKDATEGK